MIKINTKLFNLHDFLVIGIFSLLAIITFRFFVSRFYDELTDIL